LVTKAFFSVCLKNRDSWPREFFSLLSSPSFYWSSHTDRWVVFSNFLGEVGFLFKCWVQNLFSQGRFVVHMFWNFNWRPTRATIYPLVAILAFFGRFKPLSPHLLPPGCLGATGRPLMFFYRLQSGCHDQASSGVFYCGQRWHFGSFSIFLNLEGWELPPMSFFFIPPTYPPQTLPPHIYFRFKRSREPPLHCVRIPLITAQHLIAFPISFLRFVLLPKTE